VALSAYTLMVTLKRRLKALSPELKTGHHRRDQPERDRRLLHHSLSRFWGSKTTAAGASLQTAALLVGPRSTPQSACRVCSSRREKN
jgi:hypothetical protein